MGRPSGYAFKRRAASIVLSILFFVNVSGCTSWKVAPGRPAQVIVEEKPSKVRITRDYAEKVVLERPEVRADSVYGTLPATGDSAVVPLSEVTLLELRKTSTWKTIGLVYLVANAVVLAVLVASGDFPCGLAAC